MTWNQGVHSARSPPIRDELDSKKSSDNVRSFGDRSLPKQAETLAANVAVAFAGGTVLAQTLSSAVGAAAVISQATRAVSLPQRQEWLFLERAQVWVIRRECEWFLRVREPFELTVQVFEAPATYRVYRANEVCASGSLLWRDDAEAVRFQPRRLVCAQSQVYDAERGGGVLLRYHDAEATTDGLQVTVSIARNRGCSVCLAVERLADAGDGVSRKHVRQLGWAYALGEPRHQSVYGLGEMLNQLWPLSKAMLSPTPFVTWDNAPSGIGSVLSPVLLSSAGVALLIPQPPNDLHISSNAQTEPVVQYETFTTDTYIPIYSSVLDPEAVRGRQRPHAQCPPALQPGKTCGDGHFCAWTVQTNRLVMMLLVAPEPRLQLVQNQLRECLGVPRRRLANKALVERIIWSTWAEMKADVNTAKVLEMADRLRSLDLPGGIIEIDDKWQRHYGDTHFDPDKFPDPKRLVDTLHARGFLVTLWIPPFITEESANFAEARDRGLLLGNGQMPVDWWQGRGHLLNVYRPDARTWWLDKLHQLQHETGVDGFKFDAGEGAFVPSKFITQAGLRDDPATSQNDYTRHYVAMAATFPIAEVRTSWFDALFEPMVVRLFDKSSKWGTDNGLKSVVTGALTMSLLGAQIIMPDMIGGNAYGNTDEVALETDAEQMRELYVRWLQASIAMPCVQFSLLPNVFDIQLPMHPELGETVVDLVRRYLHFRERHLLPILQSRIDADEPILRPVCWEECLDGNHPLRERAAQVDDEFLVGSELLVAPVLSFGQRRRTVYLPSGQWCRWRPGSSPEYDANKALQGPCLIEEQVPLNELLLYRRLQPGMTRSASPTRTAFSMEASLHDRGEKQPPVKPSTSPVKKALSLERSARLYSPQSAEESATSHWLSSIRTPQL